MCEPDHPSPFILATGPSTRRLVTGYKEETNGGKSVFFLRINFVQVMKKKKKDKQLAKRDTRPKVSVAAPEITADDGQKPFDYGGIPDRDLKKNLGCGS
jgi:hypothetical protein